LIRRIETLAREADKKKKEREENKNCTESTMA